MLAMIGLLVLPSTVGAHLLDHAPPQFQPQTPPRPRSCRAARTRTGSSSARSRPATRTPTSTSSRTAARRYASAGTLGTGPNGGGQTIVQLTEGGEVKPKYVGAQPSASCLSNPSAALGLQHDAEASPKGGDDPQHLQPLGRAGGGADRSSTPPTPTAAATTRASPASRRRPHGGLEIVDVTNPADPKRDRPHEPHRRGAHGQHRPQAPAHRLRRHLRQRQRHRTASATTRTRPSSQRFNLDGFEVVDMSSCMNFPAGTSCRPSATRCRPQVFRYRFPTLEMAQGHTNKGTVYGCHELEVYPDDRLTCGSGQRDDRARHEGRLRRPRDAERLHRRQAARHARCRARCATPAPRRPQFKTGAKITDCVDGQGAGTDDLTVAKWLDHGRAVAGGRAATSAPRSTRAATRTEQSATPSFDSHARTSTSTTRPSSRPRAGSCSPPTSAAAASRRPARRARPRRPTTRSATAASTPTAPTA